ncbi:MAG: hypothetical protein EBU49_08585 [Proteobacteria bacterium]|nr:hypothetical protein [Pseudomonadota bacterium]
MPPHCPVFFVVLFALLSSSCGAPRSSHLKVHNGDLVDDPTGPVRKLSEGCTGSFVAPRVFVTAGHCTGKQVLSHDESLSVYLGKCLAGAGFDGKTDFRVDGDWRICKTDGPASTIGVKRYLSVSRKPVKVGQAITFMGYGEGDKIRKTGSGKLRKGSARIASADGESLKVSGVPARHGQATAPGDSGGPWLDPNGDLVGIHRSGTSTISDDDLIDFQATPVIAKGFGEGLQEALLDAF